MIKLIKVIQNVFDSMGYSFTVTIWAIIATFYLFIDQYWIDLTPEIGGYYTTLLVDVNTNMKTIIKNFDAHHMALEECIILTKEKGTP